MNTPDLLGSSNKNRPNVGSTIKVEPIRDLAAIQKIKKALRRQPRNACLFSFGINTGYRASELLSLEIGHVQHMKTNDLLVIKESKTGKSRRVALNKTVISSIRTWIDAHPRVQPDYPLFVSRKFSSALSVPSVCNLIKVWCDDVGLRGNYGSHTLRKTWGYHQLRNNPRTSPHMVLPLLMEAYGHSTQRQTLEYLCIEADEIRELYRLEL